MFPLKANIFDGGDLSNRPRNEKSDTIRCKITRKKKYDTQQATKDNQAPYEEHAIYRYNSL